jgi:hypothetical protein
VLDGNLDVFIRAMLLQRARSLPEAS